MKYLLTLVSIALISTSTFADFSVKIPLEASYGGNLPNNSISIIETPSNENNGGNEDIGEENKPEEPIEQPLGENQTKSNITSYQTEPNGNVIIYGNGVRQDISYDGISSSYFMFNAGLLFKNNSEYVYTNAKSISTSTGAICTIDRGLSYGTTLYCTQHPASRKMLATTDVGSYIIFTVNY
jgi:hypothetical protein